MRFRRKDGEAPRTVGVSTTRAASSTLADREGVTCAADPNEPQGL